MSSVRTVTTILCVVYVTIQLALAAGTEETIDDALKLIDQLKESRRGLSALKRVVSDIDSDLQRGQRSWAPSCFVGGGNPGLGCHLNALKGHSMAKQWVGANKFSPGKRDIKTDMAMIKGELEDLTRKRKGLEILKKILSEMDADLIYEQKRMCTVNLGGHCATESAASVADQWHYLNSPLSPGRKRRETKLYKSLVKGKIFK